MSLALLTLGLPGIRSAQAQGGLDSGPDQPITGQPASIDPGHYWRIDKFPKGSSFSYDVLDVPYDGGKTPGAAGDGIIEGEDIVNGSASITYTTLTWIPAAGQTLKSDPPSEPVNINEVSQAEESPGMWNGPGAAASGAGSANDGLGDPPLPWNRGCISSGTSVLHKDGSSGTIKLDDVTVGAATPISTWQQYSNYPGHYYWDWTGAEVELFFDVTIDQSDPRSVFTSSPLEDSHYKGNSEGGYSNVWDHVRTPSGGLAVDSAVAWHNATSGDMGVSGTNKGWQVTRIPLTAMLVNFLSSDPTYSWSLQGLSGGSLMPTNNNPTYLSLYKANGTDFPLHGTATVTATDSDGATFSNFYDMLFHLPVEPQKLISSVKNPKLQMDGPLNSEPCYPGLPPLPKDGRASPEGDINIAAGIDSVGLILGATGQEGAAGLVEILGKLAETAELKHHYGGEPANSYTNNQDLWNTCVHTAAQAEHNAPSSLLTMTDNTGRLDGFEFTTVQIWIVKYTLHKVWHADFYDAHGFNHDGTVFADPIDDPDGIKPEPYYKMQNPH